jgi:hypothetical protein
MTESEILQYLRNNDFVDVYVFLITSIDNLRNRGALLKNSLDRLDERIAAALRKVEANPDIDPEDKDMATYIKDIHYAELEAIQRVNIMIELLAANYHFVRLDLRALPRAIGRNDISPKELYNEFAYFKSQTLDDIWKSFRYPDANSFPELSSDEKETLNQLLKSSASQLMSMFNSIYEFQERFRPVYNKYKHTLSEITGIYGINKEARRLETQIYLRIKQDSNIQTYVLGAGSEILRYLQEIGSMTYMILEAIIDSALLHLVNLGKDCIPRTVFARGPDVNYQKIGEKIKSCWVPNFESMVLVPKPDSDTIAEINEQLLKHHVYIMNKDIMDPQIMLKKGVTLKGKSEAFIKEDQGTARA